ncbi:MAG TPA: MBL fold metallo-hydrolase [Acidimicrobiales bacterium]|nr:MBL fold metallo-hydrolase [Acidimicrobiales bacterium]
MEGDPRPNPLLSPPAEATVGEAPVTKPRRQEQEKASDVVEEVAPGVLRMQLPIDFTGLGHVNAYALIDDRGAAVIDVGMPGEGTWRALLARLTSAGLSVSDVHTVVVTHSHPDHFGSAGRLAYEAEAELVTERRFYTWFDMQQPHSHEDAGEVVSGGTGDGAASYSEPEPDGDDERVGPDPDDTGYFDIFEKTPWGGAPLARAPKEGEPLFEEHQLLMKAFRPPVPTRRVVGGDTITLARRTWTAVHTPGHTRDHLCLYDPEEQLLISGDHVLPTITPHVSGVSGAKDALADYLASIDALRRIGPVARVLPAHGHPFGGLEQRLGEIEAHHAERLEEIRRIAREAGATSVIGFSHRMFRESHWGLMAESETYAHLEYMRLRGDAESFERDGLLYYNVNG